MKNVGFNLKQILVSKYLTKDEPQNFPKSTDINVLLNRVKTDQKKNLEKNCIFLQLHQQG